MHSSRMRTARLLAVSPSMHCTGGVVCSRVMGCGTVAEGICSQEAGCVCSQGGALRQTPPAPWTEWPTGAKILLPWPKLPLRAVNIYHSHSLQCSHCYFLFTIILDATKNLQNAMYLFTFHLFLNKIEHHRKTINEIILLLQVLGL